jgi:hypothetical protein
MNFKTTLLAAAVALAAFAGSAQAVTTINLPGTISGVNNNFTVFDSDVGAGMYTNLLSGNLAAGETATFTYTLLGSNFNGNNLSGTSVVGVDHAESSAFLNAASTNTTTNPLLFSNANFTPTGGFFTITNHTLGVDSFQASLFGLLSSAGHLIISLTSSVSNVPLPSASVLFGMGLAMLAGIGAMKKKQAQL